MNDETRAVPEPDADAVERHPMQGEVWSIIRRAMDTPHTASYEEDSAYKDAYASEAARKVIAAFEQALLSDEVIEAAAEVVHQKNWQGAYTPLEWDEEIDDIRSAIMLDTRAALQAAAVEPEPGLSLDAMLRHLTDDDLPGKTLSIYRHDGQWGAQQHMTHLEEQYPTDVCGHGDGVLEAIADAVARVKGEEAGL